MLTLAKTGKQIDSIAAYIEAAPVAGQPQLNRLFELLQAVAPDAEQVIKWNTPFFIEPRFLFAFSAHKAHLNFTPNAEALEHFKDDLADYKTTQGSLQVRYVDPLPELLIERLARHRLQLLSRRTDDSFW